LLSAYWSIGQLVASVVAWGFHRQTFASPHRSDATSHTSLQYSCPAMSSPVNARRATNMGWRYTFFLLGDLTLLMFSAASGL